ncbi:MAG: CDP-diacylglycerol--serine O-phosphatidyltransferase [Candidatus Hydrogenedentota bacterium]|jgi:CDP-diacylglycerol--serine O-phosphatidyltransferase
MRQRKRMPINIAASVITTFALYCGIASIFASIRGQYDAASYWIIAAIFFDTLDGTVARLTKSVSDFGKELDSLSDIVSFGVAPAVLIYTAYVRVGGMNGGESPTGGMIAIIFVIMGALRLARYNVFQSDRQDIFVGLPIPSAAGNIASLTLFCNYFAEHAQLEIQVTSWIMTPFTLALALLMVSNIRYPKKNLGVFLLTPRKGFRTMVLIAMLIAVFHYARSYSPNIVFLPLGITYVMFGIANELAAFVTRKTPLSAPAGETLTESSSGDS